MARPEFRESLVQTEDPQAHPFSGELIRIEKALEPLIGFVRHSNVP
jgi:hypothetical protein